MVKEEELNQPKGMPASQVVPLPIKPHYQPLTEHLVQLSSCFASCEGIFFLHESNV